MRALDAVLLLSGVMLVALAAADSSSREVEVVEELGDEERANETVCPSPFINISEKCLFVNRLEEGTWAQVESLCVMLHGNLVKIDSGLFFSDLVQYIRDNGLEGNFWIGGSDTAREGEWTWRDGSSVPMGTPFWGYFPEEPVVQQPTINSAANCICLMDYLLYFFMDCSCDSEFSPICEYNEGYEDS